MKRFQKALLGVVVSGALLFSAQAAELSSSAQDTLQSAMTKVQQEIKDYGQVKTLGFTGENCEIILSNLNAKQWYSGQNDRQAGCSGGVRLLHCA